MTDAPFNILVNYLSGEFENQAQAAAEPAWYVSLKLWQRPIPQLSSKDVCTFFLEQASLKLNQSPYRQRILQLSRTPTKLKGQYFALSNPARFIGAGKQPELLKAMAASDLVSLPHSSANVEYQAIGQSGYQFQVALPDDQLCSFEYDGQTHYVYLGFDIGPAKSSPAVAANNANNANNIVLLTYDKGIDPDTGRGLWGALMGPFQMIKC